MRALLDLKINGFKPKNILDIGAYKGLWTRHVKTIFPGSEFHLVEAIEYNELQNYDNVHNVVLSDTEKEVDWYQKKNTGDSMFKENTGHFKDCEPVKRNATTLDNIFNDIVFDLIKIDVQGAEIPVLKGGKKLIEKTSFILMEMPFVGVYNDSVPNFLEHIKFMDSIGFIPYEVVEIHKLEDITIQIDFLFIKKNHEILHKAQEKINKSGL